MTAFSTAELSDMRDVLGTLLPDTCIIQSLTLTGDGEGGFTEAWAAAGTVACRLDNMSGRKSIVGQSQRPFSGWVLTVPQTASLTEANRVTHGGYTYNVIAVDYDKSWPIVTRAHVERI